MSNSELIKKAGFSGNVMTIKFTNTLWMSTVDTVTVKNNNTFALPLERQQ
jgi:hypothetical protein